MAHSSFNNDLFRLVVEEIAGKEGVEVATVLVNSDETTDEEIATKTDLKLNVVRRILYKLHDNHLASYRRIRDTDTGWFLYFWKIDPKKAQALVNRKKRMVLNLLEQRLEHETNNDLYACVNRDSSPVPFEEAMNLSFRCPVCNGQLEYVDNEKAISFLRRRVEELRADLEATSTT
ncbi:transcription factor E [Candidatus Thorarchaeota archaeon]|jgi:transcription initiation factor TFIIE subunit alpha|nr:MAG: transcription factor E [Candidatus Thorarchaeota archaeon]